MQEEQVFITQGTVRLEGRYADAQSTMGAVLSHPHPLMGGDMTNTVVETVAEALSAAGLSTLRFNFRGVGKSGGEYDEGRGEQEDCAAAIAFMHLHGKPHVILAGYSFGAWVNAAVISKRALPPALLVSPPYKLFTFDLQALRGKIGLIVCGDQDCYCPPEELMTIAAEVECGLEFIRGADHFFQGNEEALALSVKAWASTLPRGETSFPQKNTCNS
jgi:alpha/beta superfamily hydrolase